MEQSSKAMDKDLSSIMCLFRSRESQFVEILSKLPNNPTTQILNNLNKFSTRIVTLVKAYSNENGELVIKFWIGLLAYVKLCIQRIKSSNGFFTQVLNIYYSISKLLQRFIINSSCLRKYVQIQMLIHKRSEQILSKTIALQQSSSHSPLLLRNKTFELSTSKKKKSISNLLSSILKSKTNRRQIQENDHKKEKKRQEKENRKFMDVTTKLNNKLFKDLDLHTPLQKFDFNKTKKMNSLLIFDDLLARNNIIQRKIYKFQSQAKNRACQSQKEKSRYRNSMLSLENPQFFCKTMRKNETIDKKKKPQSASIILPEINTLKHRRHQKQLKRPCTSKTTTRYEKPPLLFAEKFKKNLVLIKSHNHNDIRVKC